MPANPLETRIKRIQKKLSLIQTGIYDLNTCNELEKILGLSISNLNLFEKKKNIQRRLGFVGNDVDGIFGVNTTTKIEMLLDERLPDLTPGASMIVSKKSLELVLESEISSKSHYNSKLKFPTWSYGESGITIGIGYDLGYVSKQEFLRDWEKYLGIDSINKLKTVVGKKGELAKNALSNVIKSIEIPYENALEVFYTASIPVYAKETAKIYPGIELLPPDAQGALLSLVYNRGSSLENKDSRKEMRNIVGWVQSRNLKKIAEEIRSMKRLWKDNPNMKGLLIRRDKEADLVENAKFFVRIQDYIFA